MLARDWFDRQSFNGRLDVETTLPAEEPKKVLTFDRWDAEENRWRHFRQDEDGTVTETDEIGVDL